MNTKPSLVFTFAFLMITASLTTLDHPDAFASTYSQVVNNLKPLIRIGETGRAPNIWVNEEGPGTLWATAPNNTVSLQLPTGASFAGDVTAVIFFPQVGPTLTIVNPAMLQDTDADGLNDRAIFTIAAPSSGTANIITIRPGDITLADTVAEGDIVLSLESELPGNPGLTPCQLAIATTIAADAVEPSPPPVLNVPPIAENHWIWNDYDRPTDHQLEDIIYGNGLFVAVGMGGTILTSEDTVNWNSAPSGTGGWFHSITFGFGKFYAVGSSGIIVSSSDGQNWSVISSGISGDLYSITFGAGLLVAAGRYFDTSAGWHKGLIATSYDGVNWQEHKYPELGQLQGITYGGGIFVTVGYDNADHHVWEAIIPTIATSQNGIDWIRQDYSPVSGSQGSRILMDVAYGNGKFVVIGQDPTILLSENGAQWEEINPGMLFSGFRGIAFENGLFVAAGTPIISSQDGRTWTERRNNECLLALGVTIGNGFVVAVGIPRSGENKIMVARPEPASSQLQIDLLAPQNNQTVTFEPGNGQVNFNFTSTPDARAYRLDINLKGIFNETGVDLTWLLIPPSPDGAGGTPGFSLNGFGAAYSISLDRTTWDALAFYDFSWNVSGLADSSDTASIMSSSELWNFKLQPSGSVLLMSPSHRLVLTKASDQAPVFTWNIYPGAVTYRIILAHAGMMGFDEFLDYPGQVLNVFPISSSVWQDFQPGTWYWTVIGIDASGNWVTPNYTIFSFNVQ
jgi:hypothetical protein